MRILMLAQFYPPMIGGEEQYVRTLSLELVQRGHDVLIATYWSEGLEEFEIDAGIRVYRIRSTTQRAGWLFSEAGRRHAPPFPDPEAVWGIRRVIEREQPDIVHAHNWLVYSFLPLKPWSKIPLVVTLHDYSLLCAKKRLMYAGAPCSGPGIIKCLGCASDHYGPIKGIPTVLSNWVMGAVERITADMFLAVSQTTAEGNGLLDSGVAYQVVPNFVPDDLGSGADRSDPRLEQLPYGEFLLFVGDLSPDKGIHILLRAYAGLKHAPPLVLIGRRLPETPAGFPSNVIFLNSWPHKTVLEAWRRSTIALAPSVWPEPFGLVVLEAMAAGKPVIASRIGGLSDIVVDGETGLLVPPGDVDALQQAIEALLADTRLRQQLGNNGRRRVSMFHASTVVRQIEQVYQAVVDASPGGRKLGARSSSNPLEMLRGKKGKGSLHAEEH